jgi:ABC-type dipeptide/oligopeptide/nickel transport system ATPase component
MIKNRALSVLAICAIFPWLFFAGGGPATADAAEPQKIAFIYVSSVGDLGWSYEHDNGRKMLASALGDKIKTAIIESVAEGPDAARIIRQYAMQGYKVIFATSFGYMDPMVEVAQDFPTVYFEHCSGYKTAPNLSTYFGRMYQPRYLYRKAPLTAKGILHPKRILELASRMIDAFRIDTPTPQTHSKFLSGGNIQKIILAREIDACRGLLVAAYPSRGLDVSATEYVRNQMIAQSESGKAVLLISEDLEELMAVADNIAVLYDGRIMGFLTCREADTEKLGMMMAGIEDNSVRTL